MANKIAKYRYGQKFKKGKKTLTISGVFMEKGIVMYFVNESKMAYAEHELEKMEKIK